MAILDVMMGEVAKAITAGVAGAGIKGTGQLWRVFREKVAHRSSGPIPALDELHDLLIERAREDPEWAERLALALAETNSVAAVGDEGPVFLPPIPFCDREEQRERLPEYGVFGFSGLPGSGKTALVQQIAVDRDARFAARARVNLEEFRSGDVLRLSEVKRYLLRQWGVTDVVDADPELAQQYLRVPLTRRTLLIVENALGADEVSALVADWPAALMLVTARRLTDDLRVCVPLWFELGGLDTAGAHELLASRCPAVPLDAESIAVKALLERFGHQPHAIRVLGGILTKRVGEPRPVAGLLADLEAMGIDEIDKLFNAILSGQVAQVPDGMREAFQMLALCPAGQFTLETAGIVLDYPARPVVDQLRELGLIDAMGGARFRMSWSVRRFAAELGTPADGRAALDRLVAHYVPRAVAADLAGDRPGDPRMRFYRIPATDPWPDGVDRIAWLDAEAEVLAELVEYAYLHGRDDVVGQLCGALEVLSLHRGRYELCLAAFERGVEAARRQGQMFLLARQHALCGRMATLLHRFDRARTELDSAHRGVATLPAPALLASTWEFTGRLAEEQAGTGPSPDWRPAIEAFTLALEIDRRENAGRARGLHARMLANVLVKAGLAVQAVPLLREAFAYTFEERNTSRVHTVWAKCDVIRGDLPAARDNLAEARRMAAATGADQYSVELDDLAAEIDFRAGDYGDARSTWAALAQFYADQGHPRSEEFFAKLSWLPPAP